MKDLLFSVALLVALAPLADAKHVVISPAERKAAAVIRPEILRAHVRFLSDDLLEGRGPATRGDLLTQRYIAAQMEELGLQPGGESGTWLQSFDIVGVNSRNPPTIRFQNAGAGEDLKYYEEYIAFSGVQQPQVNIANAEVVFVGYGIVAPEYGWDDYKGIDLKGKVLLMMNNDPESDPKLFAGRTRLYYGRWDYKYEMAAKMGAIGAFIIHTEPSAGYKWQVIQTSWTGEQFSLPAEEGPEVSVKGWVTEDAARRIVRLAGRDLDELRGAAQTREFKPVSMGVQLSMALDNTVQKKRTANVIGRLPGRDPALRKEAILYTAHHDHLGLKENVKPGEDTIYNGAFDNATGVAALLSIAQAMKALPQVPRRTILFAAVAAEEQGLLGSKYFSQHPTLHPGFLAANINMDGMAIWGRTRDLPMVGFGKSSLDEWVTGLATYQGRHVVPDQFPEKGFFYRSDQFSLAKIGVPAAYFDQGVEVIGKPEGWGREQIEAWEARDYHQPSDEFREDWDFSGAVEDAQLFFYLGLKVANAPILPAWKKGDEFEAARLRALSERR